jgi:uroporphyrin-III C-methyltransferase / precorrin-2 dehydrogenase / sirohydrochlorin ferrochelatase
MSEPSRKPVEAAPPRLAALSKLPLFFDLAGKCAVVIGGTAATAWKAELLAAAGADVRIVAEEVEPEMRELLLRGAAAGSLAHDRRAFGEDMLSGAAVAVADASTEQEAARFLAAAKKAGVPINVIDRPAWCDFQFGSIVNRSPVVIGISTDGAAPVLGQAIRRRIEALLPPGLATWAGWARDVRQAATERLAPGGPRRRFWERFAEHAFTRPAEAIERQTIERELASHATGRDDTAGKVTLVGAGPGDAEYLTLKAMRALQSADVILFDDLVSDEVLELARREAKRMMVGKRGRRESCRQEDINALMLKLARQGKHVVRLKSGDPMIFGRAGEEIAELRAAGIAVEVVPGITAAAAMASRLGISLTHRDHAHSVRFVTGHSRAGVLPDHLDWNGLADPETTLMVYMGGRTAPAFAERLIGAGLPACTAVAAIASISRSDEEVSFVTLGELQQNVRGIGCGERPLLIGIGRVFGATTGAKGSCPKPFTPTTYVTGQERRRDTA